MLHNFTLGELLAHSSPSVRRHAIGALKALERHADKLIKTQNKRLDVNAPRCALCGLHPASCKCAKASNPQKNPPPAVKCGCGRFLESYGCPDPDCENA